jgi:hypothetical protein
MMLSRISTILIGATIAKKIAPVNLFIIIPYLLDRSRNISAPAFGIFNRFNYSILKLFAGFATATLKHWSIINPNAIADTNRNTIR